MEGGRGVVEVLVVVVVEEEVVEGGEELDWVVVIWFHQVLENGGEIRELKSDGLWV